MDSWNEGQSYESYIGRWSRLVARDFVEWLAPGSARRWLDVGCGTGVLTDTIHRCADPSCVVGIDRSTEYVGFAAGRVVHERVHFASGSAETLPLADESFDIVVSGLMLNFVPAPDAAIAEMSRVTRRGGSVAVYLWDYAEGMQMLRCFWDAAGELFHNAKKLDEAVRFPVCQPDMLGQLFTNAMLSDVQVIAIDVPTRFERFEDFWMPFTGGQGPAPSFVNALREQEQTRLREHLRQALPADQDGSITLRARAWAARGTKL